MNLIQLLTDQRAYEGITHSRWGASWNWRWRRVGDDEDRRFPSPEPQTGSRSGLPMKNGRWRRVGVMDHDNSFSLFFSGKLGFLMDPVQGLRGHQMGTTHLSALGEGGAPWWIVPTQVPLSGGSWLHKFLYII